MIAEAAHADSKQAQRLLRLYHLYRLSVGITLVLLISSNMDNRLLTSADDDLLRSGSWLYLVLNILLVVFLREHPPPGAAVQPGAGRCAAAVRPVLRGGRRGQRHRQPADCLGGDRQYPAAPTHRPADCRHRRARHCRFQLPAGLSQPLSANTTCKPGPSAPCVLPASLLVQGLVRRLEVSETLAEQRASEVAGLETLNALILQRMRTGILVLDEQRRVQLANHSAKNLLAQSHLEGHLIIDYSPALVERSATVAETRPCARRA